jgi:hypothetical protein
MKTFQVFRSRSSAAIMVTILALMAGCQDAPIATLKETNTFSLQSTKEKGDVATTWYKFQLQMILNSDPAYSPLVIARIFSYQGIALYESVRHANPNSISLSEYLLQMPSMPLKENNSGYLWAASANAAIATVARSLYPNLTPAKLASFDSLEAAINQSFRPGIESTVFKRSQSYGVAVAHAVLQWAATDNDNQSNTGYVPPVFPGAWEPTPPLFAGAAAPFLGNARPLLEGHTTGIAPPPLHSYSVDPESEFYKMAKDLYDVSKTLTDEQRTIALFWNDVGVKKGFTPMGHSISIATQVLEKEKANLLVAAEAYARLGIALRDASIMVWRSKYHYNLLRPVTYIRNVIDQDWMPIINTPSHPEYPAAHAYITGAAMQALTAVFGENYAFTDHTYDFLGFAPREYSTLNDAGTESGMSRRFGGIHYLPSIHTGLAEGRTVGLHVGSIDLVE